MIGRQVLQRLTRLFYKHERHVASASQFPNSSHSSSRKETPPLATVLAMSVTAGLMTYSYVKRRQKSHDSTILEWNLLPVAQCSSHRGDGDAPVNSKSLRSQYNFIADVVEKVSPAVVFIKASSYFQKGVGSGFIISDDGLIVTNEHVVRMAKRGRVEVQLTDGRTYAGVVEVVDSASDLALVKITATNLPTLKLGNSSSLRAGEWVIAMGCPLNLSNTVTSGIVSSTSRKSAELGLPNEVEYLQTDAPITFGNSGGPLINLDGEAVGVNSMKVTEGISFAIPSDYVKKFLAQADDFKKSIQARRKSQPAYIGVSALSLNPLVAAQLRDRPEVGRLEVDHGIFVARVSPDSPAHRAGLRRYDVITEIDGQKVSSATDLQRLARDKDVIRCKVHRDGRVMEVLIRPLPLE